MHVNTWSVGAPGQGRGDGGLGQGARQASKFEMI